MQIAPFLAIASISFLGWVFRRLKQEAERKKIEDEKRRRKIELLRTGRPVAEEGAEEASVTQQRAKLEELARRRREKLEEFRRRQLESRQGQAGTVAPQRPQSPQTVPVSTPPNVRVPQGGQAPGAGVPVQTGPQFPATGGAAGGVAGRTGGGSARSARDAEIARRRAEIQARRRAEMERMRQAQQARQAARAPESREESPAPEAPRRMVASTPTPAPVAASAKALEPTTTLSRAMRSPAELRRAIIMNELLKPPVSMRASQDR